jgi:hypothetical protein
MGFKTMEVEDKSDLTISISDYIDILEEAKALEKLIWDLDTTVIESSYSELGQNAYHPKIKLDGHVTPLSRVVYKKLTTTLESGATPSNPRAIGAGRGKL